MKTFVILMIIFPLSVMANVNLRVVLISNQNNDGSTGTMVLQMQAESDAGDVNIQQFNATFLEDNILNALNPAGVFSDELFTAPDYSNITEVFEVHNGNGIYAYYAISSSGSPTPGIISGSAWTNIYNISITYDLSAGQTTSFSWSSKSSDFSIQQYSPYADITVNLSDVPSNVSVSPSPMPVELTTFTARIVNQKVSLDWRTATEVDNYGFEIERLSEGSCGQNSKNSKLKNWEKVGFINGHGNSNSIKNYSYIDNTLTTSRKYLYRLKQLDNNGAFKYSWEVEVNYIAPTSFNLNQNYPNPFNPTTTIKYSIPQQTVGNENFRSVQLIVYDILGRKVATLVNETKAPGNYKAYFNASNLASGVYFYRLQTGSYVQTKKMILMK